MSTEIVIVLTDDTKLRFNRDNYPVEDYHWNLSEELFVIRSVENKFVFNKQYIKYIHFWERKD